MKNLLLLSFFFLIGSHYSQIVNTQNTSSPNACDGYDIVSDSALVDTTLYWATNGTVFQNGGIAADSLCPGTYILTYTANGQTYNYTFVISAGNNDPCQGYNLEINYTNTSATGLCDGAAFALVVGGSAPYTYTWNNGVTTQNQTNLCAGVYYCTVADANGCSSTFTIQLLDNDSTVNNNTDSTIIFDNSDPNTPVIDTLGNNWVQDCITDFLAIDSVYIANYGINGDSIFVNYVFVDSSGWIILQLTSNYPIDTNNINNGYYSVFITLFCNTQKATQLTYVKVGNQIYVGTDLGLTENTISNMQVINPMSNDLNVQFNLPTEGSYQLVDMSGKVLLENTFKGTQIITSVAHLNQGVYFLNVTSEGKTISRKLVK
jgi:hypothetical protein